MSKTYRAYARTGEWYPTPEEASKVYGTTQLVEREEVSPGVTQFRRVEAQVRAG